jgi:hypothetical protein
MESGPSVREVFAGVGICDCTSPLAAAEGVVADEAAADVEVVLAGTVSVTVVVDSDEPPQAVATSPAANSTVARAYPLRVIFPTYLGFFWSSRRRNSGYGPDTALLAVEDAWWCSGGP